MVNHLAIIQGTRLFFLIALFFLMISCDSSNPSPFDGNPSLDSLILNHSYTRQFGTTRYDEPTNAITDVAGNLYITVNSRPYSGSGIHDAYLYKYDANGNFLQKTSPIACCDFDYHLMTGVSKRGNGPVYVTGYYVRDAQSYMYLAKTLADGSLRVIKEFSETDSSGNSIVLKPYAIIAHSPYEVYVLFSRDSYTFYLMKYDPFYQTVAWESYLGFMSSLETGPIMTRDTQGNFYIVTSINNGWHQRSNLLSKHNSSGSILWSKLTHPYGACGTANAKQQYVSDILADSSGNVYIAGSINTVNCDSSLHQDAYIRKYDTDGNVLWTQTFGTNTIDSASSLSRDTSGNIYLAGATLGSIAPNVANKGESDVYIRKYDANGNTLQTRQFGTVKGDTVYDLTTDTSGNVYVVGSTWGTLQSPRVGSFDAYFRKYIP